MKKILLLFTFIPFFATLSCVKEGGSYDIDDVVEADDGPYSYIYHWFDYLCAPELGGRYSGSEGIKKAVDFICDVIGRSDSLEIRPFMTSICEMNNIIYHLPGSNDSLIVVGAHYDAVGYKDSHPYPGADDNMSGVAVLLDLIKIIQNNDFHPQYSIDICFFDGEEINLYGSRHYAAKANSIKIYLNVDTCGNKDCGLGVYYDKTHPYLKDDFAGFFYLFKDVKTKVAEYNPVGYTTDCRSFEVKGIPFVHIGNDKSTGYNHSMQDVVSHLSMERLHGLARALYDYMPTL